MRGRKDSKQAREARILHQRFLGPGDRFFETAVVHAASSHGCRHQPRVLIARAQTLRTFDQLEALRGIADEVFDPSRHRQRDG